MWIQNWKSTLFYEFLSGSHRLGWLESRLWDGHYCAGSLLGSDSGMTTCGKKAGLKKGKELKHDVVLIKAPSKNMGNVEAGIIYNCIQLGKRTGSVYPCINFTKTIEQKEVLTQLIIQWMRVASGLKLDLVWSSSEVHRKTTAEGFLQLFLQQLQQLVAGVWLFISKGKSGKHIMTTLLILPNYKWWLLKSPVIQISPKLHIFQSPLYLWLKYYVFHPFYMILVAQ